VTAFDKDFVELKWEVPENDGGEPITGYLVERREVTKTAFVQQGKTDAKTLSLKATKLVEGTQYMFRVFAENSIGQSEPVQCCSRQTLETCTAFLRPASSPSGSASWRLSCPVGRTQFS